jgi:glycosyltransferase involved in cell wall biosynthesis
VRQVLLVSYSGGLGGAERVLLQFAGGMRPHASLTLACPPGPLARTARSAGIEVRELEWRSPAFGRRPSERARAALRLAAHRRELARLAREAAPRVIVANGMRSAIAVSLPSRVRLRAGGVPALVVVHHDNLPPGAAGRLLRVAARRADRVVVPSETVAEGLRSAAAVEVIAPGVERRSYPAAGDDPGAATPPEIVVLGAIVPWKRPELALEAVALARRHRPEVRLKVVGGALDPGGALLLERLRARAGAPDLAGAVEFLGPVDDPVPLLVRATALLHCAEREPFGLAVVEAMAAGRPVIVPAGSEPAVSAGPRAGLTYPPGDAAAAAAAILALLDDPAGARARGAAARERAAQRFDPVRAAQAFAQVVSATCAAPRS